MGPVYDAVMKLRPGLAEELVDTLHSVHGEHAGHRAAHAKGTCCTGVFSATAEASTLTRASHMQGSPVPATIRFSNGSGIPAYPDYARSDGRGMAVKFDLPDGTHADLVALTLPVFFARDPDSFMEFLRVTTQACDATGSKLAALSRMTAGPGTPRTPPYCYSRQARALEFARVSNVP
jgi:catalase